VHRFAFCHLDAFVRLLLTKVGANVLLPDYDTSTQLLYDVPGNSTAEMRCSIPRLFASTFDRWDAVLRRNHAQHHAQSPLHKPALL
jgi:hypothetical protein